jgi:hypothetical protein
LPIPPEEPVTSAVFPLKSIKFSLSGIIFYYSSYLRVVFHSLDPGTGKDGFTN